MNLESHKDYSSVDRQNMYGHMEGLPDQLEHAWQLSQGFRLPEAGNIKHILIAGMGGSAIGADLLSSFASEISSVSITVHRNYGLPVWARGGDTLFVASSHSGNTEETLSAFDEARKRGINRMAICTGGKLAAEAKEDDVPVWQFEHSGQPRAAVGFSFGILLGLITRLGMIEFVEDQISTTVRMMKALQQEVSKEIPILKNPAKQLALRIADKIPVVFGADHLMPVARRWKGQINELAKYWAQYEELPEGDHNTLAGTIHPQATLSQLKVILLNSAFNHPRNQLRVELTHDAMKKQGLDAEVVPTGGEDRLSSMWLGILRGDYVAYYLAMIKNMDPTPIEIMSDLKQAMKEA